MDNLIRRAAGKSPLEQLKDPATAKRIDTDLPVRQLGPDIPAAPPPPPVIAPQQALTDPANELLQPAPAPPQQIATPQIKVGGGAYLPGDPVMPEFPTSNRDERPTEQPFAGGQTLEQNLVRTVGRDTQQDVLNTRQFLDQQGVTLDKVTQQDVLPNLYAAPDLYDSFSRDQGARVQLWQEAAQRDAVAAQLERDYAVSQYMKQQQNQGSTKNAFQQFADMVGFRPEDTASGKYLRVVSRNEKGEAQFNGLNTVLYTLGLLQNATVGAALDVRNIGTQVVNTILPPWMRNATASMMGRSQLPGAAIAAAMLRSPTNVSDGRSNFVEALRGRQFSFSDKTKEGGVGVANDWGFRVGAAPSKGWGFDFNPSVVAGLGVDVVVGGKVDKLFLGGLSKSAKAARLAESTRITEINKVRSADGVAAQEARRAAARQSMLDNGLELFRETAYADKRPRLPPASFRSEPRRNVRALPPARNSNQPTFGGGTGAYDVELPGNTVIQRRTTIARENPAAVEALPPLRRPVPTPVKRVAVKPESFTAPAAPRPAARGFQRNQSRAAISTERLAQAAKPTSYSAMLDDIATTQAALNSQNPKVVKLAVDAAIANKYPTKLLELLDANLPVVTGNRTASMFDAGQKLRILKVKQAQLKSALSDAQQTLDTTPNLGRRLVEPVAVDPARAASAQLITDLPVMRSPGVATHGTRVENLRINQVDPLVGAARSELGSGVYFYTRGSKQLAAQSALAGAAENLPPLVGRTLGTPTVHKLAIPSSVKLLDATAPSKQLAQLAEQLAPEVGAKQGDSLVELFDKAATNLSEADALAFQQEVTQVLRNSGYDGAKAGDIVSIYNTAKLGDAAVTQLDEVASTADSAVARADVEAFGAQQTGSAATRGAADEASATALAQQLDEVGQLVEQQQRAMSQAVADSGLLDNVDEFAEAVKSVPATVPKAAIEPPLTVEHMSAIASRLSKAADEANTLDELAGTTSNVSAFIERYGMDGYALTSRLEDVLQRITTEGHAGAIANGLKSQSIITWVAQSVSRRAAEAAKEAASQLGKLTRDVLRELYRVEPEKLSAAWMSELKGYMGGAKNVPPIEQVLNGTYVKPSAFDSIKWQPNPLASDAARTQQIDVAKLSAALEAEPALFVGAGGANGIGTRYADAAKFMQSGSRVNMIELTVDGGKATIVDGRHRLAVLRDNGVTVVPMSVVGDASKFAPGLPRAIKQTVDAITERHTPTAGVLDDLLNGVKVPAGDTRLPALVRDILADKLPAKQADAAVTAMGEKRFDRLADKLALDGPLPAVKQIADQVSNGPATYDRLTELLTHADTTPEMSAEIKRLLSNFDDEALDKEWDELLTQDAPLGGSTGTKISPCE